MKLTHQDTTDFEPCPQGTYDGLLNTIVDLGNQETHFGVKRQVYMRFELDALRDDGKPWVVGGTYTASLHKKAKLGKLLVGWRGKPFQEGDDVDLAVLLGKCARVTVTHEYSDDGKTFAIVAALGKPTKQLKPVNDLIGDDNYLEGPEWLVTKIEAGQAGLPPTDAQAVDLAAEQASLDDEVPF